MKERRLLAFCIFVMVIGQIIILHVYRWDNYRIFRQKIEDDDRYIFVDKMIVKTFKKPIELETHKLRNIQNMEKLNGFNNNDIGAEQHNMNTRTMKDRNVRSCSVYPRYLHGKERPRIVNDSMAHLETIFKDVTNGGHWKPRSCKATKQIAIIVPLCGEFKHFLIFLSNTIPKLQRQLVEFTIYVVEQDLETECNVGLMRNIGFIEATKQRWYGCVIFNDGATIIENDRNLYTCYQGALLHMAVSVNKNDHKFSEKSEIAGIQSFDSRDYLKINGNSNFLQSDLVDVDLYQRLLKQDITIRWPEVDFATFTHLRRNQTPVEDSEKLKEIASFHHKDGLNSMHYGILRIERKQLFTKIVFKSNATYYQQMRLKYLREETEKKMHSKFSRTNDNSTTLDKSGNKMLEKEFNEKRKVTKNKEALRGNIATRIFKKLWAAPQSLKWFLGVFFNMYSGDQKALPISTLNETNKRHLNYRIAYNACVIVKKSNENIETLQKTENQTEILECPFCSPFLEGRQLVQTKKTNLSMKFLENYFSDVTNGHWSPKSCKARLRVAIIVPYRNRELHLRTLLFNLIPKLKRQQVDFTIYLVEQGLYSRFNRGLMRNIGFLIASKERDYDCYIFNDVDTIIEDDRNLFTCIDGAALHIAVAIDAFGYELKYMGLIGGILSMKGDDFNKTNGYSNLFFIWGGEDDSLSRRLKTANISILRPIENISMTTTLRHQKDKRTNDRFRRMKESEDFATEDGLKSVTYKQLVIRKKKLYIWIYVTIDQNYYEKLLVQWRRNMHYAKVKNKVFSNATTNGIEQSKKKTHNKTLEIRKENKTQQHSIQHRNNSGNIHKTVTKITDNRMRQWNKKHVEKHISRRTKSQPKSNKPNEAKRAKTRG